MNKKHVPTWKKSLIAISRFGLTALFGSLSFVPFAQATLTNLDDVLMIDGGASYSLALKSDGTVLAWGSNESGQLGNGTAISSLLPVQVSGLGSGSGVIAISAGNFHAMALKSDGTVLAWGANNLGQLGNGNTSSQSTPVQVTGLGNGSGVKAISAGFTHSLALKEDKTVLCWGRNQLGACGTGTLTLPKLAPIQVTGNATEIVAITAGANFSMALKSDTTVLAWGNNDNGQIGIGSISTTPEATPVQVKGVGGAGILSGVKAISNASISGAAFAMALTLDGTVLAWGLNENGQLGIPPSLPQPTPVQVKGVGGAGILSGVSHIVAGGKHAMARKSDGTVLAWGLNSNGQLGDDTKISRPTPIQVSGLDSGSGVTTIAAGDFHSYVRKSDGTVLAWGNNASGQLGDGTFFGQAVPVQTSGLDSNSGVEEISAGSTHALARKSDGTVLAWGDNTNGRLGNGTEVSSVTPVQVSSLDSVTAISAGTSHNLALRSDLTVFAWGLNSSGQLGTGVSSPSESLPVQVKVNDLNGLVPLTDVKAIAAGDAFSLALKSDGTMLAWGTNANGQLGVDPTTTPESPTPVQVRGIGGVGSLSEVMAISAGSLTSYALKSDGTVLAWGVNAIGQFGTETPIRSSTPVQTSGLGSNSGVIAISAGFSNHSLALKSDGTVTVLAWGPNDSGQLGDGTTTLSRVPVQVSGLDSGSAVTEIRGGGRHSLARKSDGTVLAWGGNSNGQLGDGTTAGSLSPVQTFGLDSKSGVTKISAGSTHSLALKSDGTVLAWGANANGQLGDGTVYTKNLTPSNVLSPAAVMWLGLKNSDDQGTNFDVRTELFINGDLVSRGLARCVSGVTRNPDAATEVSVAIGAISDGAIESGDVMSLTVSTRIGTNPNDTMCIPGHNNATGLRLYYDGTTRPSRVSVSENGAPADDLFLRKDGAALVLDPAAPTATTASFVDSAAVNFAGGNPWSVVRSFSRTEP